MLLHLPVCAWSVFYRGHGRDSAAGTEESCDRQKEAFLLRLYLLLQVYSCSWSSSEKKAEELDLIYKLAVNFWWQSNKNMSIHLYVVLVKQYKLHNWNAYYVKRILFQKNESLRPAVHPANNCISFSFIESGLNIINTCKNMSNFFSVLSISSFLNTVLCNLKSIEWLQIGKQFSLQ